MASVKEDNKQRSDKSSEIQQGNNSLMAYKRLEEILTDKTITFEHKIPTLVTVWQRLQELIHNSSQSKSLDKIIEWAQRHTLNLVLHGDWASQTEQLKNTLHQAVVQFDVALAVCERLTTRRCKKLIEVVKDPWGDKTLCKILNDPDRCTKEEELKYFSSEHGYLVAMRLKKLCDSHCEDLALRFANACLRCLRLPESQNFLVITTDDQKRYILDIYIALLHKYKRTHDIINELKHLTLEDGLQLVHRFTNKRVELSRVWKHCSRIAELAAQFFMTAAMTKPVQEIGPVLTDLLTAWISLNDKLEGLAAIPTIIRRIIQTADSAAQIYICCDVLNKKFGEKIKSFTIELYIRALTTDMNEMEKQKTHTGTAPVVKETSKRLAEGFLSLADLLQDHVEVSRECVLTSFSLNPTRYCMERIETFATSCREAPTGSGSDTGHNTSILDTGQKSSTSPQKPIIHAKEVVKTILSKSIQVLDTESLGLSTQLCDDLAVVLSSPRYQYLSWMLEWSDLKKACEKYLLNAESSQNTVKELKYLNIDYNQFKDWPSDDEQKKYGGIEKGYEQWADGDAETSNSSAISDFPHLLYQQANESDDCTDGGVRYRRRRKTTRRIYSSESEYESLERKVDSHGSDVDTASQDADSLGSDGLQLISTATKKKNNNNNNKRKSLSHFAMIMNAHNQANTIINSNNDDVLSIFTRLDDPNKQMTISKPPPLTASSSLKAAAFEPFLLPETKRSSDPLVLKSLRMYRSKKRNIQSCKTNSTEVHGSSCDNSDIKQISRLSHMNPKVLLDRYDINSFITNKHKSKPTSKTKKYTDTLDSNKPPSLNNKFSLNKLNMIPRVVLDRYEDIQNVYNTNKHSLAKKTVGAIKMRERKRRKFGVLADIPGLNSLELMRPIVNEARVHVVQISTNQTDSQQSRLVKTQSSSSASTTVVTNSITSTPVTAHIQRVGQPRSDTKVATWSSSTSEERETTSTAITPEVPPATTIPSPTPTLVNILSQQIIRPAQSTTATRSPHLINILSQQIIRPPLITSHQPPIPIACVSNSTPPPTTTTTTITQAPNSLKLVTTSSSQHQLIQQIFSSQGNKNNTTQLLKNVNLVTGIATTTQQQSNVDTSRLVQFLCKTDGKMIQLTPYSPGPNIKLQTVDATKLTTATAKPPTTSTAVSVGGKLITTTTATAQQSVTASPVSPPMSVRSGYEENYAKFIQTSGKTIVSKHILKDATTTGATTSECVAEQVNSLPKFQQAFGRTVYQATTTGEQLTSLPSVVGINSTSNGNLACATVTASQTTLHNKITQLNAKIAATTSAVSATKPAALIPSQIGMQTMQGSVIYTRQVPVSLAVSAGQTINLISTSSVAQSTVGRNQVLRITSASGDQMSLVKDTVIRNKMSALLAAALQSGVPRTSITSTDGASSGVFQSAEIAETEVCEVDSSSNDSCQTSTTESALKRSTAGSALLTPMRITLPMMQRANGIQRIVRPVLQIPSKVIRGTTAVRQQVVFATSQSVPSASVSVRPPVVSMTNTNNLMTTTTSQHNAAEPLVSSTTLEQLREFDLVLEQVKERSTVQPPVGPVRTAIVPATIVEKPPQQQQQQIVGPTEDVVPSVNVSYVNQGHHQIAQKISSCASVVVVTSYCNIQPAASPALSVTSQSSSSPCVTPAPSSSGGKTIPKSAAAKSPKSKTIKTTTTTTTTASKTSPVPKPQQKPQEDEQTTQRIFDILAEYAEQLRNSPDLNNKPAPRRRSNPPTNPSQNSKRKKSSGSKKTVTNHSSMSMSSDLSPGADDPRTLGSEDSSCGVVQVSVQDSPSQGAPSTEDHQSTQCSSDFSSIRTHQTESNDTTAEAPENRLPPTSGRQFIFTDSNTNQSRNLIIADSTVNEALGKFSNNAAVIFPANYIAVVSGSSKILATVPARSGSNMLLFQSFVNQARKPVTTTQPNLKAIKYSTLQPIQGLSSQNLTQSTAASSETDSILTQRLTIKTEDCPKLDDNEITTSDLLMNVGTHNNNISQKSTQTSDTISKSDSEIIRNHLGQPILNNLGVEFTQHLQQHSIKVVPISSPSMFHDLEAKEIEKSQQQEQNITQQQPSSFTLNFGPKPAETVLHNQPVITRTPVIEKSPNSLSDDTSALTHKISGSSALPLLDAKSQHSMVRSVIENQSATTTCDDMSFAQITPVDHFSKAYTNEKKSQSNSNGPMLGQTESRVTHDIVQTNKEHGHEKESQELDDTASISSSYKQKKIQGTQRTEKELQQVQQRKQAALERELHLQKSLSEECEDLGVDEPSTSDLFPEADLLFDSNNSPAFDLLSQDADKRYTSIQYQSEVSSNSTDDDFKKQQQKCKIRSNDFLSEPHSSTIKKDPIIHHHTSSSSVAKHLATLQRSEIIATLTQPIRRDKEPQVTLFSDEDNSNSLRHDMLFENLDYPSGERDYDYDRPTKRQQCAKDGISLPNNTYGTSYDDHTILSTCASIMEVCSPIHYDIHSESPPPMHKYKYKYCNRKKMQNSTPAPDKKDMNASWNTDVIEVNSSDDDSQDSSEKSQGASDRKRAQSPAWSHSNDAGDGDADGDGDDDDDTRQTEDHAFKSIYNTNKLIKLSMSQIEPITCSKSTAKMKKDECTQETAETTPPSPLSPSDSELSSFGVGRGTRRSTQRVKKNCSCCTTSDNKPKKRNATPVKQNVKKGQYHKKR